MRTTSASRPPPSPRSNAHADHQAAHVEVFYDPAQTGETALRSLIEDMGYHVIDER